MGSRKPTLLVLVGLAIGLAAATMLSQTWDIQNQYFWIRSHPQMAAQTEILLRMAIFRSLTANFLLIVIAALILILACTRMIVFTDEYKRLKLTIDQGYDEVLDILDQGVIELDQHGRIVRASSYVAALLGQPRSNLYGQAIDEQMTFLTDSKSEDQIDWRYSDFSDTCVLVTLDGYEHEVRFVSKKISHGWVLIFRLLFSERVLDEAKNSIEKVSSCIFADDTVVFILLDSDGVVLRASPAAECMFGLDELVGCDFYKDISTRWDELRGCLLALDSRLKSSISRYSYLRDKQGVERLVEIFMHRLDTSDGGTWVRIISLNNKPTINTELGLLWRQLAFGLTKTTSMSAATCELPEVLFDTLKLLEAPISQRFVYSEPKPHENLKIDVDRGIVQLLLLRILRFAASRHPEGALSINLIRKRGAQLQDNGRRLTITVTKMSTAPAPADIYAIARQANAELFLKDNSISLWFQDMPNIFLAADQVLVIDGEPNIGRTVGRILDKVNVDVAQNSEEGLEKILSKTTYSLILCDLVLPRIDGKTIYEQTKSLKPSVLSKWVFMAASMHQQELSKLVQEDKIRVLEKPFDAKALRRLMDVR